MEEHHRIWIAEDTTTPTAWRNEKKEEEYFSTKKGKLTKKDHMIGRPVAPEIWELIRSWDDDNDKKLKKIKK